jgi:HlyD family secretion protein
VGGSDGPVGVILISTRLELREVKAPRLFCCYRHSATQLGSRNVRETLSARKVFRQIAVLAALAALAVGGWWLLRPASPPPVEWQGYAEADFVKVGPTQQGLVANVRVARGDRVVKGEPLFEQDDADDRAAVDQAEANLRDAEAARDKIQDDLGRNQALLKTGAATVQVVDQEAADLRSAIAKITAMQAMLDQSKAPMGRPGEILAQTAAVEAAQAALAQARWRLDQRSVAAPAAGVIADVLAQPGETLAAGAPVVSLLPPENIFVRFFAPEPDLARLHVGDRVALTCDNCTPEITGTVSFISPQAEYTPPFIYSESTRGKFVFLAEARPTPVEAARLNPGQPITVKPLAAP